MLASASTLVEAAPEMPARPSETRQVPPFFAGRHEAIAFAIIIGILAPI
jgi:hypothetical protein